ELRPGGSKDCLISRAESESDHCDAGDASHGFSLGLVLCRRCFISAANAAIQSGRESTSLTILARSSGVAFPLANFRNKSMAAESGTSLMRPSTSAPERARNFARISKSVCIECLIKGREIGEHLRN